jgi:hypothetical protein
MNKCPICCSQLLEVIDTGRRYILDGNTIFQCQNEKTHRFWRHPFSNNILRWYPNAVVDGFIWYKAYEYEEGKITKIYINEETIGQY